MAQGADIARRVRNFKILVIVGCAGTLVLLGMEAWREHVAGEWRSYQAAYAEQLPAEARKNFEPGLRQAFLPALGRVDRCQSCHVGIDDPAMAGAGNPLAAHPGEILRIHPPDDFGCTICHQGQGRATVLPDAHGEVPHWEAPLLAGNYVYTSCGRCHAEGDLFGSGSEAYGGRIVDRELREGDLERSIPGAAVLARGKNLVARSGCLGCHQYRGRGGTLGPDLTHVGDKGIHGYDFSHLPPGVERSPMGWLVAHFRDPGAVSPGTLMPGIGSSDEDARALAAYMLSLRSRTVPPRYLAAPAAPSGEALSGRKLYELFCVACHGPDLDSSTVPAIRTPSLANEDLLDVASDAYFARIIEHGQSGTNMPAWGAGGGGLSGDQIHRIVAYIRSHEPRRSDLRSVSVSRGDARYGAALYRGRCASCHGITGEGGLGNALRVKEFLDLASDEFLARTIIEGRPGTAMPAWRSLSSQEVSDILAHLREWQGAGAEPAEVAAYLAEGNGDARIGGRVFRARCAACHGPTGAGDIGPSLTNPAFLPKVDDAYLIHAIVDGRPGTAMPAWRELALEDVGDLVAWLREQQSGPLRIPANPALRGDPETGAVLFGRSCASCHGPSAVGGVGPQLRNPVFLAHASDGFLYETIAFGRPDTPMRGFIKRGLWSDGDGPARMFGPAGIVEYSEHQVADIIAYLRSLPYEVEAAPSPPPVLGSSHRGRAIYEGIAGCIGCHGALGEGSVGPAVGNPAFLDQASEGFLIGTMVLGRGGTEMRNFVHGGMSHLTSEELMDVAAHVRTLGPRLAADPQGWRRYPWTDAEVDQGRELFGLYCISCHGAEGKGGYAPELNNPEFLSAASDGFLVATIARGRRGTPMRAFGPGSAGLAVLRYGEITAILAYLRHFGTESANATGTAAANAATNSTTENDDG